MPGNRYERARGWRFLRNYSNLALIILGVVTVVAGAWGFFLKQSVSLEETPTALEWVRLADALLYAIPLLVWSGFVDIAGAGGFSNSLLRLAQFCSVCFVTLASGKILSSIFQIRNGWRRGWIEGKPHDLCIGSGWRGQQMITGGSGQPTIVVDIVEDEAGRERCDITGAALVVCDATLGENLNRLRLDRAKRVFIACGNDMLNLRVTSKIIEVARYKQIKVMPAIITALDDPAHIPLLHAIKPSGDEALDLRHFLADEITTRMLFDTNFSEAARDRHIDRTKKSGVKAAQLILAGEGSMFEALLLQALMLCIFEEGFRFELRLIVPDPEAVAKRFVQQHPCYRAAKSEGGWLLDVVDKRWADARAPVLPIIRVDALAVPLRGQIDAFESFLQDATVASTLLIAFGDAGKSMAVAQNVVPILHRLSDSHDLALWVYANLPDEKLCSSLSNALATDTASKSPGDLTVYVFKDYLGQLDRDLAAQEALDFFASKINGSYAGLTKQNPEEKWQEAWLNSTEQEKVSSRFSAHFLQVLHRADSRLYKQGFPNETARKEILKRMEHRRWCAEYLLNGYEPLLADIVTDEERNALINDWYADKERKAAFKAEFKHLALIPWDEMELQLGTERANKEKEKDMRAMELYEVWLDEYAHKSRATVLHGKSG